MYTEHTITNIKGEAETYTVLPQLYNIKYDLIYLNDEMRRDLYGHNFYLINELIAKIFDLDIYNFQVEGATLNNLFKIFNEISLLHSYHVVLHDFFYTHVKADYLFNVIGLYVYTNCIFEFMLLGLMLFICLVTIMRLLRKEN